MNFTINKARVDSIKKLNNHYVIYLSERTYKKNREDGKTVYNDIRYSCICNFEPECVKNDLIIASGRMVSSDNPNLPYNFLIHNIGIIRNIDKINEKNGFNSNSHTYHDKDYVVDDGE